MARRKTKNPAPAPVPPPALGEVPLPAEVLTSPGTFGEKLTNSTTVAWQYWPVPVLAGLLGGLAYALLLRPGLNLAAQEALNASAQGASMPTLFTHAVNVLGSFFLTALTFAVMWGLGRLGSGGNLMRPPKVAEVYSATFTLMLPLYLLVIVLTLFTPAHAWALNPADISAAQGDALKLQHAALQSAARTPAALTLMIVTLLGTLTQFSLAYPALRATTGKPARALLGVLLPLLPALLIQFIAVAPLVLAR